MLLKSSETASDFPSADLISKQKNQEGYKGVRKILPDYLNCTGFSFADSACVYTSINAYVDAAVARLLLFQSFLTSE